MRRWSRNYLQNEIEDGIDERGVHPDMTPELAEVLSTLHVEIEHQGYDVEVAPSRRARAEE